MSQRRAWYSAAVAIIVMLAGGVVLQQAGVAQALPPTYVVTQGQMAGSGYVLAVQSWQVSGTASGPEYRLEGARILQAAGCCCGYLPCLFRHAP
jgi:hypothetical protein